MRLTDKDGGYREIVLNNNLECIGEKEWKNPLTEKLCQLEDLEEELGVELLTFFRILKLFDNSIKNGQCGESYMIFPDGTKLVTDMSYIEDFIKSFKKLIKNYGKTWALTKEELE